MPHVSKSKTDHKLMNKMKNSLLKVVTKNRNNKTILEELITETEYIMLAKRLAIIILLSRNNSIYKISKNLKVSTSTIVRFQNEINLGKYKSITNLVSEKNEDFLDMLEKILFMGLPQYSGKRRWKSLK